MFIRHTEQYDTAYLDDQELDDLTLITRDLRNTYVEQDKYEHALLARKNNFLKFLKGGGNPSKQENTQQSNTF
jgi:hypothetical protein